MASADHRGPATTVTPTAGCCEDETLLCSLFDGFPHTGPSELQSAAHARELCALLGRFARALSREQARRGQVLTPGSPLNNAHVLARGSSDVEIEEAADSSSSLASSSQGELMTPYSSPAADLMQESSGCLNDRVGMEDDEGSQGEAAGGSSGGSSCGPHVVGLWPGLSGVDLRALTRAVELLCSDRVAWFPDYGCALLAAGDLSAEHSCLPGGGSSWGAAAAAGAEGDGAAWAGGSAWPSPDDVSLLLVGLDRWAFSPHTSSSARTLHTTSAGGASVLCCGDLPLAQLQELFAAIPELAAARYSKHKQVKGHTGYSRTPSLIAACVADAMAALRTGAPAAKAKEEAKARGGFSDVGQHTGADAVRNTAWPLVREVLQELLSNSAMCTEQQDPRLLHLQCLAHLQLWLATRQTDMLASSPSAALPYMTTAACHMLRCAATSAAVLSDEGRDMSHHLAACCACKEALERVAEQRSAQAAGEHRLPADASSALGPTRYPTGVLPPPTPPSVAAEGLAAVRQRSARNLDAIPQLPRGATFAQMLQLLQHPRWSQAKDDAGMLLAVRSVERELFSRAVKGLNSAGSTQLQGDEAMQQLEAVVNAYRCAVQALLASPAAKLPPLQHHQQQDRALMASEQHSREALVVWIAYCLTYEAAAAEHPLVLQYGVMGAWEEQLRHLVLSERAAVDAALAVAAYLQRRSVRGSSLFSLHDGGKGGGTMAFALEYAQGCPKLQRIWRKEQEDAEARVEAHWQLVLKQQAKARKLRERLKALEAEASQLTSSRDKSRRLRDEYSYRSSSYRTYDDQVDSYQSQLDSNSSSQSYTRARLKAAETPPPLVLQPLPSTTTVALKWLFFLHAPPLLRRLARFSFLTAQLLLPAPLEHEGLQARLAVDDMESSLTSHYNSCRKDTTYHTADQTLDGYDGPSGQAGYVQLWSASALPKPKDVNRDHIDRFYSRSCGVWHPDSHSPRMAWAGSGCAVEAAHALPSPFFNPWAHLNNAELEQAVSEAFTERLPGGCEALQWAMWQYGSAERTSPGRANWGLAQQDVRPPWLSKPAFLAFASLRAYPLQQLRRLCTALHDRTLPLAHPAVGVLVRQLLYHIGSLSTSSSSPAPTLLWRTGWEQEGDVLAALHLELSRLADDLDPAPRDHEQVLLLGEVAAYLAAWHPPFRDVARRFADMTFREADCTEARLQDAAAANNDALVAQLRAKQLRWRAMALNCYGGGWRLEEGDVGRMAQLAVLVAHGNLFQEDEGLRQQLSQLVVRCRNAMASRAEDVDTMVQQHPHLLTAAAARVLHRTPASLPWERVAGVSSPAGAPPAGWEALGADGNLYSVNLLSGAVLLNGRPPGRLPREVTSHPLFVRTFGADTNFEVSVSAQGVLQTLRPVGGRLYDFYLSGAATGVKRSGEQQQLVVTEVEERDGGKVLLELLDVGGEAAACGQWGDQLPVRLRELHSHWLCRDRHAVLLRPHSFQQHDVHFIIAVQPAVGGGAPGASHQDGTAQRVYDVRRVPPHLRSGVHWTQLLADPRVTAQLTDQLLLLEPRSHILSGVLGKLERPQFIHAYGRLTSEQAQSTWNEQTAAAELFPSVVLELPRAGLEFELAGGELRSVDYAGYRLRQQQQLVQEAAPEAGCMQGGQQLGPGSLPRQPRLLYTLPEFRQYLVLERTAATRQEEPVARRADVLVLVPAGEVLQAAEGSAAPEGGSGWGLVGVRLPGECGATVKVHCYEVHGRFGHLRAASVLPRLQLAALYAATSTLLPEPASRCTGAQTAAELVRQCWGTRPLSGAELAQLRSVGALGAHLAAALPLLAHELRASTQQLQELGAAFGSSARLGGTRPASVQYPADAATSYRQEVGTAPVAWGPNPRQLLTPGEHERVGLGAGNHRGVGSTLLPGSSQSAPAWKRRGHYRRIGHLPPLPVPATFVSEAEAELRALVSLQAGPSGSADGKHHHGSHEVGGSDGDCTADGQPPSCALPPPPYPLLPAGAADASGGSPLAQEMHEELRSSWEAHHALPVAQHQLVGSKGAGEMVGRLLVATSRHRSTLESYLLHYLACVPEAVGPHGASFRLLRACGLQPAPGLLDLVRAAWLGEQQLLRFNPFLSQAACGVLHAGVLLWLQLCVLEDRLRRLKALQGAGGGYRAQLVQELLVHRTWDPAQHPQWLVFEAEGQLQIRPQQHTVAAQLMRDPGAIAQLNMGEGKTRVILPMLLLHWADGDQLVRLHFLSPLLDEAYAHLHTHLTASVLQRKLVLLPFHRDVQLSPQGARALRACLNYCQKERGALVVAPEHRLSLQLKWHELRAQAGQGGERAGNAQAVCEVLHGVVWGLPYVDVMDESDELLHHRWQLIYACGGSMQLPDLPERTAACWALLRVLSRLATSTRAAPLLPREAFTLEPVPGASPGAFCGLRLLPGPALDGAAAELKRRLLEELLADPLYPLTWLGDLDRNTKDAVMRCVLDTSSTAEQLLGDTAGRRAEPAAGGAEEAAGSGDESEEEEQAGEAAQLGSLHSLAPDQRALVLALRGLLGCEVLLHGLAKRHLVDHGINRGPAARKRLSVPFRAAHTPSERSEWAQPDVSLLLTHLAYYRDGLLPEQLQQAVRTLLGMGASAQRAYYAEWLELSRPGIAQADLPQLDSVLKLDPTNPHQLAALHRAFSHNMAVVDFWLGFCVLPAETQQYPQRLAGSAWHLADVSHPRGRLAGFSGTNDNHRLLPRVSGLHQARVADPVLAATNGKMLQVILDNPQLEQLCQEQEGAPTWQALLRHAAARGVHALIDCGALLAGANNKRAAGFVLEELDRSRFRGVCYFDTDLRCWAVLDAQGRCLPLSASPIPERDCFCIFDEARCRGADLRLGREAVGLLSLGPGCTKDKLMQAAGRMRQLGSGRQTLRFVAAADVFRKVAGHVGEQHAQPPTSLHVLRWVMANTERATLHGIAQWGVQGLQFAASRGAPDRAVQDELLALDELYGGAKEDRPVGQLVADMADTQRHRCGGGEGAGGGLSPEMGQLMQRIVQLASQHGEGHVVRAGGGGADEECERELEAEEEQEQEQERQTPRATPVAESHWDYATAARAAAAEQLDPAAGLVPLWQMMWKRLQPRSLGALCLSAWVWVTRNFADTVEGAVAAGGALNEYLRPVEAVLLFPPASTVAGAGSGSRGGGGDGVQLVLLSEREADQLLRQAWCGAQASGASSSSGPGPLLLTLAYARHAQSPGKPLLLATWLRTGAAGCPDVGVGGAWVRQGVRPVVSVQLFNGEAGYESSEQQEVLRELMRGRREEAEALVGMRGRQALLPRSELEAACG